MAWWNIDVLYYGRITDNCINLFPGLNICDEPFDVPYLGFLLSNAGKNILVDTGIRDGFIVNGKAFAGRKAIGGRYFVEIALKNKGVTFKQIDIVIYTHLHNDHAGNCDLFTNAKHIFQKDEWFNLQNPIPAQRVRRDYDIKTISILSKLDILMIDGNFNLLPGIKLYKTPGHSLGSQLVVVNTKEGKKVILGDTCMTFCNIFPEVGEITDLNGKKIIVNANEEYYRWGIPSSITYDYYSWYESVALAKFLSQGNKNMVYPGHEPYLVRKL